MSIHNTKKSISTYNKQSCYVSEITTIKTPTSKFLELFCNGNFYTLPGISTDRKNKFFPLINKSVLLGSALKILIIDFCILI